MVTLDTPRALHERHQLAAYCATCERWAVLDLERLIAEGRAVATAGRQAAEDRKRGRVESCGHGRTRLHGLAMTGHGPAHSC